MRKNWFLGLGLASCWLASPVQADWLMMKDQNWIEVKPVKYVEEAGPFGKKETHLECIVDEKGTLRKFPVKQIAAQQAGLTTWEQRKQSLEWYEKTKARMGQSWTEHLQVARQCRLKRLYDEMVMHFREAYRLRSAEPLASGEGAAARHEALARWLERECEMGEEANEEYRKLYQLTKDQKKDAAEHLGLAQWCLKKDLYAETQEQLEAALKLDPADKVVREAADKLKRSMSVPLDNEMYGYLKNNLQAAWKYLKSQQAADGSIGADAQRAGVLTLRGMTSLSCEALLAEWDIQYFNDPNAAGKPSPQIEKALEFLLSGKKGSGQFLGPDVWGPTLAVQCYVRALSRPYLAERREPLLKALNTEVASLKKLQRKDGGWQYYDFAETSSSFLTAAVLVNLVAARNAGAGVEEGLLRRGREFIAKTQYGVGTYLYSPSNQGEVGKSTSFSPLGASARSAPCELARLVAGDPNPQSLRGAVMNFITYHDKLKDLRGRAGTHVGTGSTAPYYYMFGHYWAARAARQLSESSLRYNTRNWIKGMLPPVQDPEGSFHDFTGTDKYQVYATALGALTMYQIVSREPDPAVGKPSAPAQN